MCGNLLCIAAVLLGVDAGWERLPDGGMLYIIQIEPELLDTLRSGEPIYSDIPSGVKDVRGYRIVVGTAELPRESPPLPAASAEPAAAAVEAPPPDPFLIPPTGPADWPTDSSGSFPPLGPSDPAPAALPGPILPAADSQPIDAVDTPPASPAAASADRSGQANPEQDGPERPWIWLSVTLLALAASLGANVYQGWIFWDSRSRYRALVEQQSRPAMD
jgi:hypothetical protein